MRGKTNISGGGLKTENLELGQDLSEFDLVKIISDIAYKNDIENILQYAIGDFDTKGDEVVFNSGTTHYTSITKMTDDIAIVCYKDVSNSDYGTSCLLNISTGSIVAGSEVVFNSGNTYSISITKMTDDIAIVCYQDNGNSNYGTSCILNISTGSIVAGSEVVFNSGYTSYTSITRMTDDIAIVTYTDVSNSNYGTSCILNISTGSIVAGSEVVFNSGNTYSIPITKMTDDIAIVCYQDNGNSNYGTSCILNISTGSIVAGSEVVFNSGSTSHISVTKMTDDIAIVTYTDSGNSYYGTSCILNISTGSIVAGSEVVFNSGSTSYTSITRMTDDIAIVCYQDNGNSNYGTSCILNISTGSIVAGSEVVFNSGETNYPSVTKMTDDIAIVCYRDDVNSYYGTSILLEIDYTAFIGKIGQLLETGVDGESKDILIFKEYI